MRHFLKLSPLLFFVLSGCFSNSKKEEKRQIFYFDLKSYFETLADSLNKTELTINKSVSKNGLVEQKKIKINDWKKEFDLFISSDINKSAWKDSYKKDSTTNKIIYTAKADDLKTRKIEIDLKNGKPSIIKINTKVDNILYHGEEYLVFKTSDYYLIDKHQKVILLGINNYKIKGDFR